MARTFQIKRGAKETMPILAQGELGFVTDSGAEELHIGTGSQNIQIARQDAVDNLAGKVNDIDAANANHNHDDQYLPLTGGVITSENVDTVLFKKIATNGHWRPLSYDGTWTGEEVVVTSDALTVTCETVAAYPFGERVRVTVNGISAVGYCASGGLTEIVGDDYGFRRTSGSNCSLTFAEAGTYTVKVEMWVSSKGYKPFTYNGIWLGESVTTAGATGYSDSDVTYYDTSYSMDNPADGVAAIITVDGVAYKCTAALDANSKRYVIAGEGCPVYIEGLYFGWSAVFSEAGTYALSVEIVDESAEDTGTAIGFVTDKGVMGYIGMDSEDGYLKRFSTIFGDKYVLIDEGNIGRYAARANHTHEISNINGLQSALNTQPDWSVNDETAPAYVKNRTHWVGDPVETLYMEEQTLTTVDGGAMQYAPLPDGIVIEDGVSYRVVVNGDSYTCVGYLRGGVVPTIGNYAEYASGAPSSGNGEPFIIFDDGYFGMAFYSRATLQLKAGDTITLALYKIEAEVHPLPPELGGMPTLAEDGSDAGKFVKANAAGDGYELAEQEDSAYLPLTGGTITGQNIYLNNGTGRLIADGEQTRIEAWNTAGDDTARRVVTLYDGEAMDDIAGAFTITDRKDSVNTEYKIYGEHNKPKPSDIGAVSKAGDYMTGNLHIQDTTNNAESFFQHYNHRTILAARNSINDGANERMIQLSDSTITESLEGAVQLVNTVDGTKSYYNIIHEGNKELIQPGDIGAAAEEHTHTATEVGALPIEGGAITGTSIYLNNGTGRLMANGDAAQIEAWTTAGDDSERRILTMYDKGAKSDVASSLVLTDRVGSINTEYKIYGEHNKPTLADVGGAVTKTFGASNSAAIYVKISDFGAWGTGTWYQKGFSMLISSRAGETVWLSVSADDSNTNAKAFRLMNTYSKIVAVYYSASESAVYVKANAWCNNICAHILSNVYGDYVPTIAQASSLASDAVEVKITEFGPSYDHVAVGRSDQPIKLKGSSDRPLYNDQEIALKSDLDALLASAITVHSGTVEPTSNMGSDGDLYVYTGG